MHRLALPLLLLLSACHEYNLGGEKDDPPAPLDTDVPLDTIWGEALEFTPEDTAPPPPEEECNGEDDDGDGLIDEGFEDVDGDGIADCVDDACEIEEHPGGAVSILPETVGEPTVHVSDPWDAVIEWSYDSPGNGAISMPAVGNLTDDNGDGLIDENDIPDIAFIDWTYDKLIAISGDGSGELFVLDDYDGDSGVVIADVDVDGEPEVVAYRNDRSVVALDGAGNVEWASHRVNLAYYPQAVVGDIDADGTVEVVYDLGVINGEDGSFQFVLPSPAAMWRTPVLADIDADGTMEIILGEDVFGHDGLVEWSASNDGYGNFAAVADVDGDIGGEVFFVTGEEMQIYEPDGTPIAKRAVTSTNPGPPAVADFDGDGEVELALTANTAISLWELSGAMVWESPVQDISGLAGCSGYDFNGDGVYELLYADETTFRIYDGPTGTVLYENEDHHSDTLWEYPVIADVDLDGSAEIVIASNGLVWSGVTVLGHRADGWAASGPTWGTHDFAVTNLNPDGSVPSPPVLPWTTHNLFRARPQLDGIEATSDLTVLVDDVCVASCEHGPALIGFAVANQGSVTVGKGVQASLYAVDDGVETWLASVELDELVAGRIIPAGSFELHPDQWGDDGVLIRVDDVGTGSGVITEYDESNNTDSYADAICGG
jgi:hypothetical protein